VENGADRARGGSVFINDNDSNKDAFDFVEEIAEQKNRQRERRGRNKSLQSAFRPSSRSRPGVTHHGNGSSAPCWGRSFKTARRRRFPDDTTSGPTNRWPERHGRTEP
jgi:hypothetical protein